jgi:hypothetical protein
VPLAAASEAPSAAETPVAEAEVETLSYTQRRIVDEYGWPETFALLIYAGEGGDQPVRQETWNYHSSGLSFTFVNGELAGRRTPLPDVPGAAYPDYRPSQFRAGMSFEDVANALPGIEEFAQEQMPDEQMSTYWVPQLVMGFIDNVLAYVETRPQLPESGAQEPKP